MFLTVCFSGMIRRRTLHMFCGHLGAFLPPAGEGRERVDWLLAGDWLFVDRAKIASAGTQVGFRLKPPVMWHCATALHDGLRARPPASSSKLGLSRTPAAKPHLDQVEPLQKDCQHQQRRDKLNHQVESFHCRLVFQGAMIGQLIPDVFPFALPAYEKA